MSGLIIGIDEVGRGPLAGPLVVGACALKAIDAEGEDWQNELTDSKRLTEKKRERLAKVIRERAVLLGLGRVEAEEIDRIGLAEALRLAARMALVRALGGFGGADTGRCAEFGGAAPDAIGGCAGLDNFAQDGGDFAQNAGREDSGKRAGASDFLRSANVSDLKIDEIIIDGTQNFLKGTLFEDKVTTMKKADLLVKPVSAAAIFAKVYRDGVMRELASEYQGYDFENNVGYGTKKHLEALAEIGPCTEHRFSYKPVQKACEGRELGELRGRYEAALGNSAGLSQGFTEQQRFSTAWVPSGNAGFSRGFTGNSAELSRGFSGDFAESSRRQRAGAEALSNGWRAEMAVAEFLMKNGQTILARNFKTRNFEIDIISATAERIYFTEVKYRKNAQHGSAAEFVTVEKRRRMRISAEVFMDRLAGVLGRTIESLPAPQLAIGAVEGDFVVKDWFPLG